MKAIGYKEFKKFARPYTSNQLCKKTGLRKIGPANQIWSDGFILIMQCGDKLASIATEMVENFAGETEQFLESEREKGMVSTRPVALCETTLKYAEFQAENGKKMYIDARYLRWLWDRHPDGEFFCTDNTLFLFAVGGDLVGAIVALHMGRI